MRLMLNPQQSDRTSPKSLHVLLPVALAALGVVWSIPSSAVAVPTNLAPPIAGSTALSDDPVATPGNFPPVITDFFITSYPGYLWTFEGTVTDENPGTVIIVFGGLLTGVSVPVNDDGSFLYTNQFPPGTNGGVTARAIDEEGNVSERAEDLME